MENSPKLDPPQDKAPKKRGYITGLLVGSVVILFFTFLGLLFFVYTDFGTTLVGTEAESIQTKVRVEECPEVIELELVNEGWALYSIPEYGFSVEVPNSIAKLDYGNPMHKIQVRWEASREEPSDALLVEEGDVIDSINIDFKPESLPTELRECAPKCTGEFYINVYVYERTSETNLEEIILDKEDTFNSFKEYDVVPLEETLFEDISKYDNSITGGAWCVVMPNIGGEPYTECYVQNGSYFFKILYEGDSRIDGEVPEVEVLQNAEKIVDSMKFE